MNDIKDAANHVIEKHSELFWKLRVNELEEKIKQLESFIEGSLGIKKPVPTSPCADPISYCNSCGCGKKEAVLAKAKKEVT
jgi:hypothetical protein